MGMEIEFNGDLILAVYIYSFVCADIYFLVQKNLHGYEMFVSLGNFILSGQFIL